MTTVAALVEQTRQRLSPSRQVTLNKLNGAVNASVTSATMTYDITGIGPNTRLGIGLEDVHVWTAVQSTKVVDAMQRGMSGAGLSHVDGTLVYVAPEFSTFDIVRAFNEVLTALPGEGVHNFDTVDLTSNSAKLGYNLTSIGEMLGVHQVRYSAVGAQSNYVIVPRRFWNVGQAMPTADFAAGEALFIYGGMDPGRTVNVVYMKPFTALDVAADTDLADVVETQIVNSGETPPSNICALLVVGAARLLTQGRPTDRSSTTSQGQTRRPDEVTTNDTRMAQSPLESEWLRSLKRARKEQATRFGG